MNAACYQPSGKAPVKGLIIALLGSIVAAILCSIVYIALQWFIPFIYINVLFAIGFGIVVGAACSFLLKKGKVRNKAAVFAVAGIAALMALYSQWALFISLKIESTGNFSVSDINIGIVKTSFHLNTFAEVFFNPKGVFEVIRVFNEVGTFSLKGSTVTGAFLWIIWIIEAGIIIVATYIVADSVNKHPYSETYDKWMDKVESKKAYVQDTNTLKSLLDAKKYDEVLSPLKESQPLDDAYSEITIYHLLEDSDAYISIDNVTVTQKGKEKKKHSTNVLKLLHVPYSAVRSFL